MNYNDSEQDIFDMPLKHFGVKGMRWGIRRTKNELRSIKREIAIGRSRKKAKDMSDADLKKLVDRIKNENALKRLGKHKEYITRHEMDDKTLKKRVDRLQLEDSLKKNVAITTKTQKEIGKAITSAGMGIAMTAYKNKDNGGVTKKDAADIVKKEMTNLIKGKNKIIDAGFAIRDLTKKS